MADRRGECKRCGECCKAVAILLEVDAENDKQFDDYTRWLSLHNGLTVEVVDREKRIINLRILTRCSALVELKDGHACYINSTKPDLCTGYPIDDDVLIKGCGFSFAEEK